MSTVKCNAKDPSSCRFHRPDAAVIAKAALDEAKANYADVDRRLNAGEEVGPEYTDARWAIDKAEEAYYGTTEGIADITEQMKNESDPEGKFILEMKLASAKYALADAERTNAINQRNGGSLVPEGKHTYEPGGIKSGGNSLWPTTTGSKYEEGLTANRVKTLVNADIKEAQKKNYLPKHVKFAVRSRGNQLSVQIIGAAPEQIYEDPKEMRRGNYTKQSRELLARVQGIVTAYQDTQYDVIESRTNYANFWDTVDYESTWEQQVRVEKEEKKAAAKASA